MVLTTPLFRELKRIFPSSRCTVVSQPGHQAILATNRNVDEILPLRQVETKWLPERVRLLVSALRFYWTRLRHRQFDMAISPRWDVDENFATMLCVLTNADKRIGHSERASPAKRRINRGFDAAFDWLCHPARCGTRSIATSKIVEALGGRVEDRRLEIRLTADDRKFASDLLMHHDRNRLLVAIGIGGRSTSRRWPLPNYAELIARMNEHRTTQPVIVCSDEEDIEASELSTMLAVPPYILSGVPLRCVCAVLARCDLFVGNDSGPAHLAAAMDCPTVVISQHPLHGDANHANSPARFSPHCSQFRVVQPSSGAGKCMTSCRATEPHCIKLVTVEMALNAAIDLLRQSPRSGHKNILHAQGPVPTQTRVTDEAGATIAAGVR